MILRRRLENGLTLFMKPYDCKAVAITVVTLGGGRDDRDDPISHKLEHAIMRATRSFPTESILTRYFAPFAHRFNADTDETTIAIYGSARRRYLAKLVRLMSEVAVHPRFDVESARSEHERHDEESRELRDSRQDSLWVEFDTVMFGRNGLKSALYASNESPQGRAAISTRSLFFEHRKRFVGERICVAVVGGFDPHEAERLVRYRFAALRRGSARSFLPVDFQKFRGDLALIRDESAEQINFAIGWPTFGFTDQQRIALGVLRNLLSHGPDSRLKLELDSKGRCYSSADVLWFWRDIGQYAIHVPLAPDKFLETLSIIAYQVRLLRTELISQEDLDRSIIAMANEADLQELDPLELSLFMARQWANLGHVIPASTYIRLINTVSRRKIREVANAILVQGRRVLVAQGPLGKIRKRDILDALRVRTKEATP